MLLQSAIFLGESTGYDHVRVAAIAEYLQQEDYALVCDREKCHEVVIYCDERWLPVLKEMPVTPQVDLSFVPIAASLVREWGKRARESGDPNGYYAGRLREEFKIEGNLSLASELVVYPKGSVELSWNGVQLFIPDDPFLCGSRDGVAALEAAIVEEYGKELDRTDCVVLVSYSKPYSDKDKAVGGEWARKQSLDLSFVWEVLKEKSIDYPEGVTPICIGYSREPNDRLLDPLVDFANGSFQDQIDFFTALQNVCTKRGKGLWMLSNPCTSVWTALLTTTLDFKVCVVGESEFERVASSQRCYARRLETLS